MTETFVSSRATGLLIRGQDILYKFFVGSLEAVPEGIEEKVRESDAAIDRRNADAARKEGRGREAQFDRVRPGRVDTGKPVYQHEEAVHIASLRSLLAHKGYKLSDAHFFAKDRGGYVIVLRLSREGQAVKLPGKAINALRALARDNRWKTHVWDNGDSRPSTVNFTERSQKPAEQMLVIRDGFMRLVDLDGNDAVNLERIEDEKIADDVLRALDG